MTMRMLIDARHPEETRVAVVDGTRIEEFDFEAAAKKQIKGNIYLAKVTRVEPSLQAAFIDYGGNRHGFLAFSEIHPDYYQIPREDRERLLREERALDEEEARAHDDDEEDYAHEDHADAEIDADAAEADGDDHDDDEDDGADDADAPPRPAPAAVPTRGADDHHGDRLREARMALRRRYKIQDVIKRRQVLLVQVVKEERGNKGAALTTYLSLAGRYCVLMPNTSHGGGISRKINSAADRRRLKSIMEDLQLPSGMAAIVRTAGLSRSKTEINRDFDYLTRLWDEVREATLGSTAPALIHEDSDLIKRAIRDIFTREIEEVLVEGEAGFMQARTFMKLLMPTHAKRVKQYIDPVPLFQRGLVEGQLNAMFQPTVQLRSGGYIVINQTEALVAIDINSGRSTREHNIEETATKTNIEATDEIARQLRLRDLAGLVVIDFIDMENNGNNRRVERAMKDALSHDRARIQVGRISSFGLLEMSRQRLRTGVLEASTQGCPMCEGTGLVRSVPSAALAAIRGLEEEAVRGRASLLTLRAAIDVAVYILNRKRAQLADIEERYGVRIEVTPDGGLISPHFGVEGAGGPPERPIQRAAPMIAPPIEDDDPIEEEDEIEEEAFDDADADAPVAARGEARGDRPRRDEAAGEGRGGRKRRRRRRGGRRDEGEAVAGEASAEQGAAGEARDDDAPVDEARADDAEPGGDRRRRRRGRRGGRGRAADDMAVEGVIDAQAAALGDDDAARLSEDVAAKALAAEPEPEAIVIGETTDIEPAAKPKRARRTKAEAKAATEVELAAVEVEGAAEPAKPKRARRKAVAADAPPQGDAVPELAVEADAPPVATDAAASPRRKRAPRKVAAVGGDEPAEPASSAAALAAADADAAPDAPGDEAAPTGAGGRRGWWQRTFG